jgi:hypothetical protein
MFDLLLYLLVCSDGSDEAECEEEDYRTCSEDERACHNGKCIHLSKVGPMICTVDIWMRGW